MKALMTAAAVLLGVTLAGCGSDEPEHVPMPSATTTAATSSPQVVMYAEGTGTKSANVTMRTESGGTIQKSVALPMGDPNTGKLGVESTGFKSGDLLYMSLQNSESSGSITCRIEVDGKVIDKATSSGAGVVATCQGRVP
jgi:predicted small lipoprotein YifL